MESTDMPPALNFKNIQDHPIKVILAFLLVSASSVWAFYRPALIDDLAADFVPWSEMQAHEVAQAAQFVSIDTKLNTLIAKDRRKDAYATIDAIEGDIQRHNKLKNGASPAWLETNRKHEGRLEMAISYRDCVMENRLNCDQIKDEIWQ